MPTKKRIDMSKLTPDQVKKLEDELKKMVTDPTKLPIEEVMASGTHSSHIARM